MSSGTAAVAYTFHTEGSTGAKRPGGTVKVTYTLSGKR